MTVTGVTTSEVDAGGYGLVSKELVDAELPFVQVLLATAYNAAKSSTLAKGYKHRHFGQPCHFCKPAHSHRKIPSRQP